MRKGREDGKFGGKGASGVEAVRGGGGKGEEEAGGKERREGCRKGDDIEDRGDVELRRVGC